ncbi:hypothetical protein [Mycobacteroides abscessus]|uniref:hypothetical protein n=1 Tax=Mycobacteroides abscessus TaxID=36809 RepID=UPI00266ED74C|nr:hypothetical protein [Mycobacteroides abscessus]MDO3107075.1 hypothetical protein [Mycobacteroides abscessus subsp. abscessus]
MEPNTTERQQIKDAIERVISGNPLRSNGSYTVVTLAKEAGVHRTRLYEQYPELIAEFKMQIQQTLSPSIVLAANRELAEAHERADRLVAENALLRERIRTLSAVIAELSIQNSHNDVIRIRR